MTRADFYLDRRYCPRCQQYVRYLTSIDRSYCVDCAGPVKLFSSADRRSFQRSLKRSTSWRPTPGESDDHEDRALRPAP